MKSRQEHVVIGQVEVGLDQLEEGLQVIEEFVIVRLVVHLVLIAQGKLINRLFLTCG